MILGVNPWYNPLIPPSYHINKWNSMIVDMKVGLAGTYLSKHCHCCMDNSRVNVLTLYLESQPCSDGIEGISEEYSSDSSSRTWKEAVEVIVTANQAPKYGFVELVGSKLSCSIWEDANHLSSIAFIKCCQVFNFHNFIQAWKYS